MRLDIDAADVRGPSPVETFLGANWIGGSGPIDAPHLVAAREIGLRRDRIGDFFDPGPIGVSRDASGALLVDFGRWETVLAETERNLGAPPLILVTYMPPALWREELRDLPATQFGAAGQFYPPASWGDWDDLISQLAAFHVNIGRAGLQYEIWNEPDMPHFWAGTVAEYAELYVRAARAIKREDPTASVGGPSVSRYAQTAPGTKSPYILEFLKELIKAAERLGEPVHLDFLSFHHYPNCWLDRPRVKVAVEAIHLYLEASGIGLRPPLSLTEWCSEGGDTVSLQRMANHPVQTVADQLAESARTGEPPSIRDAYYYMLLGKDGNTELLVPDESGSLQRTPAATSFEMLSRMTEGNLLGLDTAEPLAAIATRTGSSVRVLLTNNDETQTHTALVRVRNLPWGEGSTIRVWRRTLDETVHWDHVHIATEPPVLVDPGTAASWSGSVVEYSETLASTRELILAQHLGPCAVLLIELTEQSAGHEAVV